MDSYHRTPGPEPTYIDNLQTSAIFIVWGPPEAGGSIFASHLSSAPAVAVATCSPICTRTVSPASDHPQIGFGLPPLQHHVVTEDRADERRRNALLRRAQYGCARDAVPLRSTSTEIERRFSLMVVSPFHTTPEPQRLSQGRCFQWVAGLHPDWDKRWQPLAGRILTGSDPLSLRVQNALVLGSGVFACSAMRKRSCSHVAAG